MTSVDRSRIVILGGGACALAQVALDVTLIDRHNDYLSQAVRA